MGACNPYRRRKREFVVCGLSYPNDDNDLIYLVNLLPQSLMFYIFNFGSIAKPDEDLYISSIIHNIFINKEAERQISNIKKCFNILLDKYKSSKIDISKFEEFLNEFLSKYERDINYNTINCTNDLQKINLFRR